MRCSLITTTRARRAGDLDELSDDEQTRQSCKSLSVASLEPDVGVSPRADPDAVPPGARDEACGEPLCDVDRMVASRLLCT